ncbi:hypothetical protein Dimus_004019, partial [Dionaea muscipula]
MDEWVATREVKAWLFESSKCSRKMGFWETVQCIKASHLDVDEGALMSQLQDCDDIEITTDAQAFFLLDLETGVVNDPSYFHGGPASTAEGSYSLTPGHTMNFEELMSYTIDVAALAQRVRELSALTNAGLGADEISDSGVNQEAEGVTGGGGDATDQHLGSAHEEGRVDILEADE